MVSMIVIVLCRMIMRIKAATDVEYLTTELSTVRVRIGTSEYSRNTKVLGLANCHWFYL